MSLLGALARALGRRPSDPPLATPTIGDQVWTMEGSESRRNAALKMLDDDCRGFLLVTVHHDGEHGRVELALQLRTDWWPAVAETLERVISAARE